MNKWKKRHSTHLRRQPCWVWQTFTHRNRNLKNRSRPEKFSFYFWLLFTFPGRVIRRNKIYLTSHTITIEIMTLKKSHRLLKIVIDTLKKICECEGVREGSSGWLHVLMSRGLRTQVHRSIPVCLVVKYTTVHILVPLFSFHLYPLFTFVKTTWTTRQQKQIYLLEYKVLCKILSCVSN